MFDRIKTAPAATLAWLAAQDCHRLAYAGLALTYAAACAGIPTTSCLSTIPRPMPTLTDLGVEGGNCPISLEKGDYARGLKY